MWNWLWKLLCTKGQAFFESVLSIPLKHMFRWQSNAFDTTWNIRFYKLLKPMPAQMHCHYSKSVEILNAKDLFIFLNYGNILPFYSVLVYPEINFMKRWGKMLNKLPAVSGFLWTPDSTSSTFNYLRPEPLSTNILTLITLIGAGNIITSLQFVWKLL